MTSIRRAVLVAVAVVALVAPSAACSPPWVQPVAAPSVSAPVPAPSASVLTVPVVAKAAVPAASKVAKPSRILLSPTADAAHSQRISWTMPRKQSGQAVRFRRADGSGSTKKAKATKRARTTVRTSGTNDPRYQAVLTGLRPGTSYDYRIVTKGSKTSWARFTTSGPAAPLTMLALGDLQVPKGTSRSVMTATVKAALAAAPTAEAVLQAGDIVDRPYSARMWKNLFSAIGSSGRTRTWIPSIGNHEQCVLLKSCRSAHGAAFRSYFGGPSNGVAKQAQTWYWTDERGVRIVVLDPFGGRLAEQATFLDRALRTNPHRWSVVVMHAGPFGTRPGRSNPQVRSVLWPVMQKRGVDLVIAGHDHSYARGQQDADGPVVVVSVSGSKYYAAADADWRAHGARVDVAASQTTTYGVIRIAGDRLDYRAVVSAKGARSSTTVRVGGVLDRFSIVKAADGTDRVVDRS